MEARLLREYTDRLSTELSPRTQIVKAASPGRHQCELVIESPDRDGRRARLLVDLAPHRACLFLTKAKEVKASSAPFLSSLTGRWITGVDQPSSNPLLRLFLRGPEGDETWLVFEWLGGRPQALLIDAASQEVLATLEEERGAHAARREVGAAYAWPPLPRRPLYGTATAEQVEEILTTTRDDDPSIALAKGFADLPVYLAYEATTGAENDAHRIAARLRQIGAASIEPVLYRLREPIEQLPPVFVSPIPLSSLAEHRSDRPGSLFHLIEHAHEAVLLAERKDTIRDSFLRLIDSEITRLTRLHRRLSEEKRESETAPLLRRHAEALLVHTRQIERGAERFSVPDPANPDVRLEIELDPRLSVSANADRLFRKAKRLERGGPLRRRRIEALEEKVVKLSEIRERGREAGASLAVKGADWLREALGRFARPGAIEAWERRFSSDPVPGSSRPAVTGRAHRKDRGGSSDRRERFSPRTFKTREGWTVLVGRSNRENDYVSHSLADGEDYWFHVHGCPGSHVVLRREGRRDNPSRRTIEEVAAIAAFFSKARTSGKAPVVYTLKKYVRKPRGGAAGLALVTREKTILVEPRAPEEGDPGGWGDDEAD